MSQFSHGFFRSDNAASLKKACQQTQPRIYLELGCWIGKSMGFVLSEAPRECVAIGIDTWHDESEHPENFEFQDQLYETFVANLWNERDRIVPVRGDTRLCIHEVASLLAEDSVNDPATTVDLVYVDAGHDYDSVLTDLTNLVWLFPRATLVLDDHEPKWGPGVVECVARFEELFGRSYTFDFVDKVGRVPILTPPESGWDSATIAARFGIGPTQVV